MHSLIESMQAGAPRMISVMQLGQESLHVQPINWVVQACNFLQTDNRIHTKWHIFASVFKVS